MMERKDTLWKVMITLVIALTIPVASHAANNTSFVPNSTQIFTKGGSLLLEGVIGGGELGGLLIGAVIGIVILIAIWSTGSGFAGALIVMPALVFTLAIMGMIPRKVIALTLISIGVIGAWGILNMMGGK